jgi:hypothetical protein
MSKHISRSIILPTSNVAPSESQEAYVDSQRRHVQRRPNNIPLAYRHRTRITAVSHRHKHEQISRNILRNCRHLRSLSFNLSENDEDVPDAFVPLLLTFFQEARALESIHFDNHRNGDAVPTIPQLATAPSLTSLSLHQYFTRRAVCKLSNQDHPASFQSLRRLYIYDRLSAIIACTSHIASPELERLTIGVETDGTATPESLDALVRILERKFSSLRYFSFEGAISGLITGKSFISFLSGICLVELVISIHPNGIIMDDIQLENLARASGSLEILWLDRDNFHYDTPLPAVTILGMFTLLRHCPRIHDLCIRVNALNIDVDNPPLIDLSTSNLQILDLGMSPIDNPHHVAELFSAVLPFLEQFHWHDGEFYDGAMFPTDKPYWYSLSQAAKWNTVWSLQPILRRARRDERAKPRVAFRSR